MTTERAPLLVDARQFVKPEAGRPEPDAGSGRNIVEVRGLNLWYGTFQALDDISFAVPENRITAIIGPSGCGKSTILRCINRMNDLLPGFRAEGEVIFEGVDVYASGLDPVDVRRRIGMVFQKPNPFPKSIYENAAFGPRINGFRGSLDEIVERSLRRAALWDEVGEKLRESALKLSGGQQQRLCIARALDTVATLKIEDLMRDLARNFTIVIVTHNMQQAARVSDFTMMMMMDENRSGVLVEYGRTREVFTNPKDKRTEDYITGRFG